MTRNSQIDIKETTMIAPKYNRSRVMKMAWRMYRKNSSNSFSECLKKAWESERDLHAKDMKLYELRCRADEQLSKREKGIKMTSSSMAFMANTLTDYYANNRYNGD